MGGTVDECGGSSVLITHYVYSVRPSGISGRGGQCGVSPFAGPGLG